MAGRPEDYLNLRQEGYDSENEGQEGQGNNGNNGNGNNGNGNNGNNANNGGVYRGGYAFPAVDFNDEDPEFKLLLKKALEDSHQSVDEDAERRHKIMQEAKAKEEAAAARALAESQESIKQDEVRRAARANDVDPATLAALGIDAKLDAEERERALMVRIEYDAKHAADDRAQKAEEKLKRDLKAAEERDAREAKIPVEKLIAQKQNEIQNLEQTKDSLKEELGNEGHPEFLRKQMLEQIGEVTAQQLALESQLVLHFKRQEKEKAYEALQIATFAKLEGAPIIKPSVRGSENKGEKDKSNAAKPKQESKVDDFDINSLPADFLKPVVVPTPSNSVLANASSNKSAEPSAPEERDALDVIFAPGGPAINSEALRVQSAANDAVAAKKVAGNGPVVLSFKEQQAKLIAEAAARRIEAEKAKANNAGAPAKKS
jgi:hypothetical protein